MEPTFFSFIWKYSKRRQLALVTVLHIAGTSVPDIDDGAHRDV